MQISGKILPKMMRDVNNLNVQYWVNNMFTIHAVICWMNKDEWNE